VDPTLFNFAKWNGKEWSVSRVYYPYQGQQFIVPLHAAFYLDTNDMWVGSNQPMHWNGTAWQTYDLPASVFNGWISKIWACINQDVLIVGTNGSISYFDGSLWQKIESGTTLSIKDVYGVMNSNTGQYEVYCAVTAVSQPENSRILRITSTTNVESQPSPMGREIMTVWPAGGSLLYAGGDGLFSNDTGSWRAIDYGSNAFISCVRGSAANDVFAVGDGIIVHWNGATWKVLYNTSSSIFYSVSVKKDLVVAVGGTTDGKAIAVVGRRY
jgi:hypothetical protein